MSPDRGGASRPVPRQEKSRIICISGARIMGDRPFFVKNYCYSGALLIKCEPFAGKRNVLELFLVFLIFGLLGLILIFMNKLLGPSRTNPYKEQPFECGSPYLEKGIKPFPIKFYLVAFIFLLFDVEVVFFFPWALIFKDMGGTAFLIMMVYVAVLIVGFIYAWKKGAFEWE